MRNSSLPFSNRIVSHSCCVGRGLVLRLMLAVLLFPVCLLCRPVTQEWQGEDREQLPDSCRVDMVPCCLAALQEGFQMRANTQSAARCTGRE